MGGKRKVGQLLPAQEMHQKFSLDLGLLGKLSSIDQTLLTTLN